jgi:hypothetical protein
MGETKKIVVENYPAHKLPEELRRGLEQQGKVRVTIESADACREKSLVSFVGSAAGCYPTPEDANNAIRTLRDEWE